jgi:hypothetical protein
MFPEGIDIPNWLFHALELYGMLTLTALCFLYALVLHAKVRGIAGDHREQCETMQGRLSRALDAMGQLRTQLEEAARQSPTAAPAVGPAINLNKRGQALRMNRRGESPETIAGALGVPRNEVDLLLKVHCLALEHVE